LWATSLPKETSTGLAKFLYRMADTNRDAELTKDEFTALSQSLQLSADAAANNAETKSGPVPFFSEQDTDNSKTLDMSEFAAWHRRTFDDMTYLTLFTIIDADRNRHINKTEYRNFVKHPLAYLQAPVAYILQTLDKNSDGKLSLSEIDAVLRSAPSLPVVLSHVELSLCLPADRYNQQNGAYLTQFITSTTAHDRNKTQLLLQPELLLQRPNMLTQKNVVSGNSGDHNNLTTSSSSMTGKKQQTNEEKSGNTSVGSSSSSGKRKDSKQQQPLCVKHFDVYVHSVVTALLYLLLMKQWDTAGE